MVMADKLAARELLRWRDFKNPDTHPVLFRIAKAQVSAF